ncbi:MAG: Gldg family protein [Bacteroidales bacterium]|nr:Gldg family protein [Bacteroidales bacterium]
MKIIYKIARTELRQLFSSPIAWLILAIFSFQAGLYFTQLFNDHVVTKEVGDSVFLLTERIFTSFFRKMQEYLYLYIPLLTMGLLSTERRTGTIKLLYSSPITNSQIALGKYLSMMIYNLIIVVILLIPVVFGSFHMDNLDYGHIFSAILALYLLSCAYAAVGLFMSSLTSYQIFSGLATLTLLSVLGMVGKMWQTVPVLRDVAYWICISGRANKMIGGLICSEDVLYFILISLFFILLTICKLNGEREKKALRFKILEYASVVLFTVAFGYVTIIPKLKFYIDTTDVQKNTIAVPSIETVKSVKGDITVTTFVNLLDRYSLHGLPDKRVEDRKGFEGFIRFNKGMKFKYVYYYGPNVNPDLEDLYPGTTDKEKMQQVCANLGLKEKMFKTHEEVEAKYGVDLSGEGYRFVRLLSTRDGSREWLRTYDDASIFPREEEIAAAVGRLVAGSCKTGYLCGHGERNIFRKGDRELFVNVGDKRYRKSLINNGFEPVELTADREIPSDIEVLFITDPKAEFTEDEIQVIKDYLDRGGNAFFSTESGHQKFINPIVNHIGVDYKEGCLLQASEDYDPELVTAIVDSSALDLHRRFRWMKRWNYRIPMGRSAEYQISGDNGFVTTDVFVSDPKGVTNEATGVEKRYPLISQMCREVNGREQRIIVAAETDWLTYAEASRRRTGLNAENAIAYEYVFRLLSGGRFPCDVDHPADRDNILDASHSTAVKANIIFMGIIPLMMVIFCVIIRAIRKRK